MAIFVNPTQKAVDYIRQATDIQQVVTLELEILSSFGFGLVTNGVRLNE